MPPSSAQVPTFESATRLLAVAHGTASSVGLAAVDDLVAAVRAERPDVQVDRCYLDVADPRLHDALDDTPTVVVPLLLSTGYHVETDIPAAVASHPNTSVAAHLGPDDLLTDVLADRLGAVTDGSVVLVGAGSTRAGAAAELRTAADLLAARIGRPVEVRTVSDGLQDDLAALPRPVHVATYLLSPGRFVELVGRAVDGTVADPLGVHPSLIELIWKRFDVAVTAR